MNIGECVHVDDIWHDQRGVLLTNQRAKGAIEQLMAKMNASKTQMWIAERGTARIRRWTSLRMRIRHAAIWLGLVTPTWWERVEADPLPMIGGRHLMDALNHRRA